MPDITRRSATWRRLDVDHGLGFALVEPTTYGPRLEATEVVQDGDDAYGVWFEVRVHPSWDTDVALVRVTTADSERAVSLRRKAGEWLVDATARPELAGCVDVDVAATPLTNTLPVRRLGLAVGEAREFPVAWVDVPSLAIRRSLQHYTRLPPQDGLACYEYRDDVYGPFVLTVDEDGLVVDYEGFASRVGTAPGATR